MKHNFTVSFYSYWSVNKKSHMYEGYETNAIYNHFDAASLSMNSERVVRNGLEATKIPIACVGPTAHRFACHTILGHTNGL